jgi:predicted amidohydrolase YtcJ
MLYKVAITAIAIFFAQVSYAQPDIIIFNGKIFTGDNQLPFTEAIAIRGERILAVGKSTDLKKLATKKTRMIDAGGRLVTAGINDAHDHVGHLDIGRRIAFKSAMLEGPAIEELIDSLKLLTSSLAAGTWITGNIGLKIIGDSTARRAMLDLYSPQHPIILNAPWGHGTLINTEAMKLLHIDPVAADPAGGNYERYHGKDSISGLLHEYAGFTIRQPLQSNIPDSVVIDHFNNYSKDAARLGITSVQNMATGLQPAQLKRVVEKAKMPTRMRVIHFPGSIDSIERISTAAKATNYQNNLLSFSGIKWIIDGTPLERKAFMRDYYTDHPGWRGELNFEGKNLELILKQGYNSGDQLLLHISGDSTPAVILHHMTKIAKAENWNPKRLRFEHADGLIASQLPTLKKMGIVAVLNPMHFTFAEANHARLGKNAARYQPFRSLIEAGIPVAIGSDGPNNPWLNIMFATIHPSNPREAITREQALIAYTSGSAYAEFMEKEKGKLVKGMLADVIILSQDILTVNINALPATRSLVTIVNGKVVHDELRE